MKQLIEQVLNNNHNIKIKSFIGDAGAYDSNENFKYLNDKRIRPIIKVKRNSIISSTRITRYGIKKLDFKQKIITNGKRKESMDNEWMAKETAAFSSIKRMFGEYTSLLSGFKLVKEMTMKVSLYNLFRRII